MRLVRWDFSAQPGYTMLKRMPRLRNGAVVDRKAETKVFAAVMHTEWGSGQTSANDEYSLEMTILP